MSRAAAEAIGMRLKCLFQATDCVSGVSVSLTAVPTPTHVRVTVYRHLQYPNSLATSGVLSTCCCCHVYSRNRQRLDHLERHGVPLREPVEGYNRDCKWHLWLLCGGAGWSLQVGLLFPFPYTPGHKLWVFIGSLPVRSTQAVWDPR